jgi:hypothetical protein
MEVEVEVVRIVGTNVDAAEEELVPNVGVPSRLVEDLEAVARDWGMAESDGAGARTDVDGSSKGVCDDCRLASRFGIPTATARRSFNSK